MIIYTKTTFVHLDLNYPGFLNVMNKKEQKAQKTIKQTKKEMQLQLNHFQDKRFAIFNSLGWYGQILVHACYVVVSKI